MKKLWCTNFLSFKRIALENEWNKNVPNDVAIISINNSLENGFEDEYHVCNDAENVLNLNFDDVDPTHLDLDDDIETFTYKRNNNTITSIHFFTKEMANKSVDFIEKNKDKNFFIHCSAGISRSQAFVLFIQNTYFDNKFELNPTNPCISPNGHVYSKLCEAHRIKNNIS